MRCGVRGTGTAPGNHCLTLVHPTMLSKHDVGQQGSRDTCGGAVTPTIYVVSSAAAVPMARVASGHCLTVVVMSVYCCIALNVRDEAAGMQSTSSQEP